MDGVLMECWKSWKYIQFSIPIFGLVIVIIIYSQLALWYKYPFESELCLERELQNLGKGSLGKFGFCILLQILLDIPRFIYTSKILSTMKIVVGSYIDQNSSCV